MKVTIKRKAAKALLYKLCSYTSWGFNTVLWSVFLLGSYQSTFPLLSRQPFPHLFPQSIVLSSQQIQSREHCALHRCQSEHPATFHPAGADDWRRHEELPETEQATSCMCLQRAHLLCLSVHCSRWNYAISRVRPLHCQWGSCCRWPGTLHLAVATWRRTTSYTGSHQQPDKMKKIASFARLGALLPIEKLHLVTDSVFFQRYCC